MCVYAPWDEIRARARAGPGDSICSSRVCNPLFVQLPAVALLLFQLRENWRETVEDAGQAMREARRSLMGLRGDDTTTGLASAIAQTARQLVAGHHLKLRLSMHDAGVALSPEVEYHFLRIAQEAILNAVKHAGCRTLKVTLERDGSQVRLSVVDDGVGFDGEPAPGHYGLIGMRERASQIGGRLVIDSGPGRGTAVSLAVAA